MTKLRHCERSAAIHHCGHIRGVLGAFQSDVEPKRTIHAPEIQARRPQLKDLFSPTHTPPPLSRPAGRKRGASFGCWSRPTRSRRDRRDGCRLARWGATSRSRFQQWSTPAGWPLRASDESDKKWAPPRTTQSAPGARNSHPEFLPNQQPISTVPGSPVAGHPKQNGAPLSALATVERGWGIGGELKRPAACHELSSHAFGRRHYKES